MAGDPAKFFELSLDLLCTATDDYHFDLLSPSWERTLGWTLDELRAKPFLEFCHPDDVETTNEQAAKMLHDGVDAVHFENRYRHKDGHYIWLSWMSTVSNGTFYAVAHDISDYKAKELQFEQVNAELRQFAYAASHDLQEPLRTITGFIQLAEGEDAVPDELAESFYHIKDGADRMQGMLRGLLDYSRIDSAAKPHVAVALSGVVERVQRLYPELRASVGPLPVVTAEPSQMERLIQNILSNAARYKHTDRDPRVEITAEETPRSIILRFRDNGVGIHPGQENRALTIFARCHSRTQFPEGHGVGLALCKRIVERHGGSIALQRNQDGEGLTVTVEIGDGGEQ